MGMSPSSQRAAEPGPDLRFLFSELVRLETELWNAVEARLRASFGVTLPVFEFLQVISRTTSCRVHDIAAELSITDGGTSKIVDRIEASGYCARSANPNDRRSSVITLTPAGKKLLPKLTAAVDDELRKRLGTGVTEKSLVQLTKTLSKLRASVRADDAAAKAG
jgi:MarR family transcriptional regulator, organic hydroperoxide resistance regulator